jgi:hypothetical protein
MRAVIEVVKGGGMVIALDAEAKAAIGGMVAGASGEFFNLVQRMTGTLDRISRLPVVPLRFVGQKKKGARRAKRTRA